MRTYEKCRSCVIHEEMKSFLKKYANGDISGIGSREFLEKFSNECPAVKEFYESIVEFRKPSK